MILETSVGRTRVNGFRVVWQGAMRRMAIPCNEEQRGQATRKPCNRVRSSLTLGVTGNKDGTINIHTAFIDMLSGQLRFPG